MRGFTRLRLNYQTLLLILIEKSGVFFLKHLKFN